MKPVHSSRRPLSLIEQMRQVEQELKSGHSMAKAAISFPERSQEQKADIEERLKRIEGSITPERAIEINADISRMRDEEWN